MSTDEKYPKQNNSRAVLRISDNLLCMPVSYGSITAPVDEFENAHVVFNTDENLTTGRSKLRELHQAQ